MISQRLTDFLEAEQPPSPCLVIDSQVVAEKYQALAALMPESPIFYAVKANPAPEILKVLVDMGASFDAASLAEIDLVLQAGAKPEHISFGNTIKKERDIAAAFARGITLFAMDCPAEVEKIARAAPGASVFCRIQANGDGANWSLGNKFGCPPDQATEILKTADRLGLTAIGLSFHVGSQQSDVSAFERSISQAAQVFRAASTEGLNLSLLNLGGGFPANYLDPTPPLGDFATAIAAALNVHFGDAPPRTIIEPGRALVGDAGIIKSEIVLISRKSPDDDHRWVYLDIGRFGGLAETLDEAIRYPINSTLDGAATGPCILAGPTCDSVDVLYEKSPYRLPLDLQVGQHLLIGATGAYTASYASVGFNGFAPLHIIVI